MKITAETWRAAMNANVIRMSLSLIALSIIAGCSRLDTVAEPEIATTLHPSMPSHAQLQQALKKVVLNNGQLDPKKNGGFGLNMWATVVDRDGVVRAVVFTGKNRGEQWPGSRVISAQKANTANAFSLPGLALSTANIFTATQPGGSLSGLQFSNPVNTDAAYGGNARTYGQPNDYMVGRKIGGVNVFGGGLALYNSRGEIIGAVGVSGDSSCADHNIAWKLRDALKLDYVPGGVSSTGDDNIIYDIGANGKSAGGFGHPTCSPEATAIGNALPSSHPTGRQTGMSAASSMDLRARAVSENFTAALKKLGAGR
jgi:uncharacterized protein GlcG (DUF336 family)